ncbi:hypothetical protein L207DRAFT_396090, partial [Hyaloscypha variabilis F]
DVQTDISYYKLPEDGIPLPVIMNKDTRVDLSKCDWQLTTVYDVRGSLFNFTLDVAGFQSAKHKSSLDDYSDDAMVKERHYPEVVKLLETITGSSKVIIFHHQVRQARTHYLYHEDASTIEGDPTKEKQNENFPPDASMHGPVRGAHTDLSYDFAPEVLKMYCPDQAEQFLKGRFQVINVWRPIKTIYKDPFAVLDARTMLPEDLAIVALVGPQFTNNTFSVKAPSKERKDGGHKWYYMSQQTPEDVLLFKNFDSKTDGRARAAPHTSFDDNEFKHMDARQSLEIRAFVFHEDDVE